MVKATGKSIPGTLVDTSMTICLLLISHQNCIAIDGHCQLAEKGLEAQRKAFVKATTLSPFSLLIK
jgi:hypothetical protein